MTKQETEQQALANATSNQSVMRFLFWLALYLLSVGTLDIDVQYSDGVRITFHSWLKNRGPRA